jgi:dipeptidyl-peptidase-4
MNKSLLFTLTAGLLYMSPAQAQLKRLSQQQTLGTQPSLTIPLNPVTGWADAQHYIEMDIKDRSLKAVDVNTGKKESYTPPPKSNVNVMVKEADVFIQRRGKEPDAFPGWKICGLYPQQRLIFS